MSDRFSTARHCHAVLCILLKDLYAQFDEGEGRRLATTDENLSKRRKLDTPSTISMQPQSPSATQMQLGELDSQQLQTKAPNKQRTMMAPSTHGQFSQPIFEYQQPNQTAMPWSDPMMSGDVGDVFGQVSWEALFQGDGSGWEDWDAVGGV